MQSTEFTGAAVTCRAHALCAEGPWFKSLASLVKRDSRKLAVGGKYSAECPGELLSLRREDTDLDGLNQAKAALHAYTNKQIKSKITYITETKS